MPLLHTICGIAGILIGLAAFALTVRYVIPRRHL
jgi:hypothetical protein